STSARISAVALIPTADAAGSSCEAPRAPSRGSPAGMRVESVPGAAPRAAATSSREMDMGLLRYWVLRCGGRPRYALPPRLSTTSTYVRHVRPIEWTILQVWG